jgi:hypothetical protein
VIVGVDGAAGVVIVGAGVGGVVVVIATADHARNSRYFQICLKRTLSFFNSSYM